MLHPYLATVLFQWQLQVDPYDPSLPLISTYLYIYFYWTCSCSKEIWNTARWILSNTITYWISSCVYDRRIKYKEIVQMRGKWMSCHLHVVRKPHERILVRLLKAKFAPLSSVTIKQDSICPTQGHMFDSMFFFSHRRTHAHYLMQLIQEGRHVVVWDKSNTKPTIGIGFKWDGPA